MHRLTVAVDFDKCLIKEIPPLTTNYELQPYARETITELSQKGVEFVLNTSRYGWYYRSAVRFIKKEKLPIARKFTIHKVRADIYIDDCNIFCQNIDWQEIKEELIRILGKEEE